MLYTQIVKVGRWGRRGSALQVDIMDFDTLIKFN